LQNYSKWFIVGRDPCLDDFHRPKFASFSLEENNLGNYILGVKNIIPARIFLISLYFLRIEIAIFA